MWLHENWCKLKKLLPGDQHASDLSEIDYQRIPGKRHVGETGVTWYTFLSKPCHCCRICSTLLKLWIFIVTNIIQPILKEFFECSPYIPCILNFHPSGQIWQLTPYLGESWHEVGRFSRGKIYNNNRICILIKWKSVSRHKFQIGRHIGRVTVIYCK